MIGRYFYNLSQCFYGSISAQEIQTVLFLNELNNTELMTHPNTVAWLYRGERDREREIDKHTKTETLRQIDRQTDRQIDIHTDRQRQRNRHTDRLTDGGRQVRDGDKHWESHRC